MNTATITLNLDDTWGSLFGLPNKSDDCSSVIEKNIYEIGGVDPKEDEDTYYSSAMYNAVTTYMLEKFRKIFPQTDVTFEEHFEDDFCCREWTEETFKNWISDHISLESILKDYNNTLEEEKKDDLLRIGVLEEEKNAYFLKHYKEDFIKKNSDNMKEDIVKYYFGNSKEDVDKQYFTKN